MRFATTQGPFVYAGYSVPHVMVQKAGMVSTAKRGGILGWLDCGE